ncbi:MAG: hypothetical protein ACYC9Z_10090 [Casimicrobiaceae bacterium]
MDRAARILSGLFLSLLALDSRASQWEFAGGANVKQGPDILFFDADSISHPTKNTVRLWLKGIPQAKLERRYETLAKSDAGKIAPRIAGGYEPRLYALQPIRAQYPSAGRLRNAIIDATVFEAIANDADTPTSMKMYLEIDCATQRDRTLSIEFYNDNGDIAQESTPGERAKYDYIAPDTNTQWWAMLFCPAGK